MLNTAIVENSTKSADRLIKFLDRFSEEHGEEIRYTWYQGTHTFLSEYHFQFLWTLSLMMGMEWKLQ